MKNHFEENEEENFESMNSTFTPIRRANSRTRRFQEVEELKIEEPEDFPSLPQSIIDRQNREFIRGNPPIPKLRAGRQLLRNGASVDMHEEKDTADFSVPFQILWLTVFYGTRITGDIGY
jgi:hypothetical protein